MNIKSSVFAIRALGVLALIAVSFIPTGIPAGRSGDADTPKFAAQPNADPPHSAPIILAQGRCYNGKCY